jgi:uncharacterized RDD family membrane protein YckC
LPFNLTHFYSVAMPLAGSVPTTDLGTPNVNTASREVIEVRVAGLWRRVLAGLLDLVVISPAVIITGWIVSRSSGLQLPDSAALRPEAILDLFLYGGARFYATLGAGAAIVFLYVVLFLATIGATPGLKAVRACVINRFGELPEWWRVILRCLGWLASALLLGLGLLWIGFDREKRGLLDHLAGTYVIRSRGR